MLHAEWVAEYERARKLRTDKKVDQAIEVLEALEAASKRTARDTVDEWHMLQALELRAILLRDRGRIAEAKKAYELLAKTHRQKMGIHGTGLVNALSVAALLEYESKQDQKAEKLAREAVQMFGRFFEPGGVMVELLKEVQSRGAARVREKLSKELEPKKKARAKK
ncbi:MAG: tetratricopeptide repeat protein [Deltaproteobacteria bacterium]|nr:tetratricopeptide repeat protein [Deltaproteobacteria bacterium]